MILCFLFVSLHNVCRFVKSYLFVVVVDVVVFWLKTAFSRLLFLSQCECLFDRRNCSTHSHTNRQTLLFIWVYAIPMLYRPSWVRDKIVRPECMWLSSRVITHITNWHFQWSKHQTLHIITTKTVHYIIKTAFFFVRSLVCISSLSAAQCNPTKNHIYFQCENISCMLFSCVLNALQLQSVSFALVTCFFFVLFGCLFRFLWWFCVSVLNDHY